MLSTLVSLLDDPDYGIRADAVGALGYLGDPRAFEPLVRLLRRHRMVGTLQCGSVTGYIKDPRACDVLVRALK